LDNPMQGKPHLPAVLAYNGCELIQWKNKWLLHCASKSFSGKLNTHLVLLAMATGNTYFDDLQCNPEVIDPPQTDDMLEVNSHVTDPAQTALKPNVTVSSSVRELLECPVCLNAMYPPIHQMDLFGFTEYEIIVTRLVLPLAAGHHSQQNFVSETVNVIGEGFCFAIVGSNGRDVCSNGHTLCSGCKPRVHNRCPTCRHELGNIRCLALEKVAASLELPCKYQSFGCMGIYPYYSKLKHESQCVYRPYNCPYAGSECTVIGDIPYLVAHLKDDHKVDMHSGITFNHRYVKSNPHEVENATWMLTVFSCFGQYFCLHFEAYQLGMAPVYIAFLRFMGDDNEAKNYSYSLEVGGNGRKMIWQGVPRSIRDSHRKVRDSCDGLIIQRNMALFFSGGDRKELKLRVTGRIWKEQ
ncbi:Seven-in-absentia protein, TRAF-like domain, partial [Dillenia turbinata]